MNTTSRRSRIRNWILASLGLCSVALGIVGIFVPGLPTTVFLLIASWLFTRSCPALQRWLHSHPHLGTYLQMARERRMPLRAKVVSIAAIWGGITLALLTNARDSTALAATLVTAGVIGTTVVLLLRQRRPRMRAEPAPLGESRQVSVPRLTRVQASF